MSSSIVQDKSEQFSLRIIKLYKYLSERTLNREKILSLQLLRSGTSIGANIAESECAISKNDFKAKLYISLKNVMNANIGFAFFIRRDSWKKQNMIQSIKMQKRFIGF